MRILSVSTLVEICAVATVLAFPGLAEDDNAVNNMTNENTGLVTQDQLNLFKFFAQYAGASYCPIGAVGSHVYCKHDICPASAKENATIYNSYYGDDTGVAAFTAIDHAASAIIVSVRGSVLTIDLKNWITNFRFEWVPCDFGDNCKAHGGFLDAYQELRDRNVYKDVLLAKTQYPKYDIIVTGHSLGGAVASLLGAYLREMFLKVNIYTFGSPRIGNAALVKYVYNQPGKTYRITHYNDVVPRLPPMFWPFCYRHTAPEYWLEGGPEERTSYTADQIEECQGSADDNCNAGLYTPNVDSHLYYFVAISHCGESESRLLVSNGTDEGEGPLDGKEENRLTWFAKLDMQYVEDLKNGSGPEEKLDDILAGRVNGKREDPVAELKGWPWKKQKLIIIWVFFGLCVTAFILRAYIRHVCFQRLLVEDWLMLLALCLHLVVAILGQLFLGYVYDMAAAENGQLIPGADFYEDSKKGLRAFGISCLVSYAGIWVIKINFLVFFYRLGHQFKAYFIGWWIVLILVVGCGAAEIGTLQYHCLFGSTNTIFGTCSETTVLKEVYIRMIMSCVLDVLSDAAILCFPISILWRVKISLRKKLILGGIFGLVGFTIAVTIVRGSIFGGVYKSINADGGSELNVSWIWFWLYVEYTVSFIIACCVSFRALFLQQEHRSQQARDQQRKETGSMYAMDENRKGFRAKFRRLHESLLDTCRNLECTSANNAFGLPVPPSARLSVNFEGSLSAYNLEGIKMTGVTRHSMSAADSHSYSGTTFGDNFI
ncbi:Lipase [Cytospora mali]|uniref:Lipase n=1 Tax=Cytospora mali TaxID=578113 RepID=A0A194W0L9_CYTMA|nr:Lipase [Valsa mali]